MPPSRQQDATMSRQDERKHICHEQGCGAAFTKRAHLRRHEVTHTPRRDFVCPGCARAFSRNDSMERHLKRKHPQLHLHRHNLAAARPLVKAESVTSDGAGSSSSRVVEPVSLSQFGHFQRDRELQHVMPPIESASATDSRGDSDLDEMEEETSFFDSGIASRQRSATIPGESPGSLRYRSFANTDPRGEHGHALSNTASCCAGREVDMARQFQHQSQHQHLYQHHDPHSQQGLNIALRDERQHPHQDQFRPSQLAFPPNQPEMFGTLQPLLRHHAPNEASNAGPEGFPYRRSSRIWEEDSTGHLQRSNEHQQKLPQYSADELRTAFQGASNQMPLRSQTQAPHDTFLTQPWQPAPLALMQQQQQFPGVGEPSDLIEWFYPGLEQHLSQLWPEAETEAELAEFKVEASIDAMDTFQSLGINEGTGGQSNAENFFGVNTLQLGLDDSTLLTNSDGLQDFMNETSMQELKPYLQPAVTSAPVDNQQRRVSIFGRRPSATAEASSSAAGQAEILEAQRRGTAVDSQNLPPLTASQIMFLGPDPWNASLTRVSASQGDSGQLQGQPGSQNDLAKSQQLLQDPQPLFPSSVFDPITTFASSKARAVEAEASGVRRNSAAFWGPLGRPNSLTFGRSGRPETPKRDSWRSPLGGNKHASYYSPGSARKRSEEDSKAFDTPQTSATGLQPQTETSCSSQTSPSRDKQAKSVTWTGSPKSKNVSLPGPASSLDAEEGTTLPLGKATKTWLRTDSVMSTASMLQPTDPASLLDDQTQGGPSLTRKGSQIATRNGSPTSTQLSQSISALPDSQMETDLPQRRTSFGEFTFNDEHSRDAVGKVTERFHRFTRLCQLPLKPGDDVVRRIVAEFDGVIRTELPIYHPKMANSKYFHFGEESLALMSLAAIFTGDAEIIGRSRLVIRFVGLIILLSAKMQIHMEGSYAMFSKCFLLTAMYGVRGKDTDFWNLINSFWSSMSAYFCETSWRKLDYKMDRLDVEAVSNLEGNELFNFWEGWYKHEHLKRTMIAIAIYDSQQSAYFAPLSPPTDSKAKGPFCQYLWGSAYEPCPESVFLAWPPEDWARKIAQNNSLPSKGAGAWKKRPTFIATELCDNLLKPHIVPLARSLANAASRASMDASALSRRTSIFQPSNLSQRSRPQPRRDFASPDISHRPLSALSRKPSNETTSFAFKPRLPRMVSQYHEYALLEALHGAWMADTTFYLLSSWGANTVIDTDEDEDEEREEITTTIPSFAWLPGWRKGRCLSEMEVAHALLNWSANFSGSTLLHYRRLSGSGPLPTTGLKMEDDTFQLTIRWQAIFLGLCAPLESICLYLAASGDSKASKESQTADDASTSSSEKKDRVKSVKMKRSLHSWAHSASGRRALVHAATILDLYSIRFNTSNGVRRKVKFPPTVSHAVLSSYAVLVAVMRLMSDEGLINECDACQKTAQFFKGPLNAADENVELMTAFHKRGGLQSSEQVGDWTWVWFWHLSWELVGAAGIPHHSIKVKPGFHDWMQADRRKSIQPNWGWDKRWSLQRPGLAQERTNASPEPMESPKGANKTRFVPSLETESSSRRATIDASLPQRKASRLHPSAPDPSAWHCTSFRPRVDSTPPNNAMELDVDSRPSSQGQSPVEAPSGRKSSSQADEARRMRRWILDGATELARFRSLPMCRNHLESSKQPSVLFPGDFGRNLDGCTRTRNELRKGIEEFRQAEPKWCFADEYFTMLLAALV